jgi:hypothetical protein
VDKELNWTLSFTATSPLFQFEEKEGLKRKDDVVKTICPQYIARTVT